MSNVSCHYLPVFFDILTVVSSCLFTSSISAEMINGRHYRSYLPISLPVCRDSQNCLSNSMYSWLDERFVGYCVS